MLDAIRVATFRRLGRAADCFPLSRRAASALTTAVTAIALVLSPDVLAEGGPAARPAPASAHAAEEMRPAEAPAGWRDLCRREALLCRHHNRSFERPPMTEALRRDIERINGEVNAAVTYVTDRDALGREEYWSFPIDGRGDCEDIALEKRRRLAALGLPRSALLIAVVLTRDGDWHALLTVETASGPLVLDNLTDAVERPEATGHRFVLRQSRSHPDRWVAWPRPADAVSAVPKVASRPD